MKPILIIFSASLIIFSTACENSLSDKDSEFMGTWIEQTDRMDTIDFTIFGSDLALNLRRGYEFQNGYFLPRYGSGFYAFEFMGSDTIGLCSYLSSSCISGIPESYPKYYFKKINANTFRIRNFYNPDKNPEEVFTFSRIKDLFSKN
jgi:hypothetical protein